MNPAPITLLMRHGYTDYLQGNTPVSIDDANDLNEKGIAAVTRSAIEIAAILKVSTGITIYSSPMGRALHTAKIVKAHLDAQTETVELVCAPELSEIHNFNWDLFAEAVRASELDTGEHPTDNWFALDLFRELSADTLNKLPPHLKDFVLNVESAGEAKQRLLAFLDATANTPHDKIYVSHDGVLCPLLHDLTDGRLMTCTRSHYFEVVPGESDAGWKIGRTNLSLDRN